ncbi:MAG: hypothetical protein FJX74_10670 [Armatimonadetes bacterium]|nr:hypothetical protein [Armatimonadota bacterium]
MARGPAGLTAVLVAWVAASAALGAPVTIDADHVTAIAGEPVFPIGFTLGPPPDGKTPEGKDGLQELADAGATFLRTGPSGETWTDRTLEAEQTWQDAAAEHGLLCWVFLRELGSVSPEHPQREALLRRVVTRFRDHPGLGFWKGEDEPAWGNKPVEPILQAYRIIKELDPNHPVQLTQAPRNTVEELRAYNAACDITACDIYPVSYPPGAHSLLPNREISMVGDYTRTMMEVANGELPVWMVLQVAFSGVIKPGKTLRFPTFPQERFMAYQAIINGARGLVFFGGNLTQAMAPEDAALGWNWRFWRRVLRPLMEEIGRHSPLHPALIAPNSRLPLQVRVKQAVGGDADPAQLEFRMRETPEALYLLACKREGATVEVEFSGLPVALARGEVLYEEPRAVEVTEGRFTDWFGPFEVHVYRLARG